MKSRNEESIVNTFKRVKDFSTFLGGLGSYKWVVFVTCTVLIQQSIWGAPIDTGAVLKIQLYQVFLGSVFIAGKSVEDAAEHLAGSLLAKALQEDK